MSLEKFSAVVFVSVVINHCVCSCPGTGSSPRSSSNSTFTQDIGWLCVIKFKISIIWIGLGKTTFTVLPYKLFYIFQFNHCNFHIIQEIDLVKIDSGGISNANQLIIRVWLSKLSHEFNISICILRLSEIIYMINIEIFKIHNDFFNRVFDWTGSSQID